MPGWPFSQDYSGNTSGYNKCKTGTDGAATSNVPGASGRGSSWFYGHTNEVWNFTTLALPNDHAMTDKKECMLWSQTSYYPARSRHPDGVQACLGDGSVRFISDSIDILTWRAMGTLNGGEVVSY